MKAFIHQYHPVPRKTGLREDCVHHCDDWTCGSFSSTVNSLAAMNISSSPSLYHTSEVYCPTRTCNYHSKVLGRPLERPHQLQNVQILDKHPSCRKAPDRSHLQMTSALEEDFDCSKRGCETKAPCTYCTYVRMNVNNPACQRLLAVHLLSHTVSDAGGL